MGDGTALKTICGMEAKINSIQMLSQMVWARSMGVLLDLADIICLNPTEFMLKCSNNSSLAKIFRTGTMAPVMAEAISVAAAVGLFLAAVVVAALLGICRLITPLMLTTQRSKPLILLTLIKTRQASRRKVAPPEYRRTIPVPRKDGPTRPRLHPAMDKLNLTRSHRTRQLRLRKLLGILQQRLYQQTDPLPMEVLGRRKPNCEGSLLSTVLISPTIIK
jgi:hypothetical protein